MLLKEVTIAGYRSIRKSTTLFVEPNATIILGPNDHGKTNCLNALLHLNSDNPFLEDVDLNWDCSEQAAELPSVVAHFTLTTQEIEKLVQFENELIEEYNVSLQEAKLTADVPAPSETQESAAASPSSEDIPQGQSGEPAEPYPLLTTADFSAALTVKRVGVKGILEVMHPAHIYQATKQLIQSMVPRFELINPVDKLSDSVTIEELSPGLNDFMRGIFYYAGLDPDTSGALFEQNDHTLRRLDQASKKLDQTLRETWSQGRNLGFKLIHDSKNKRIDLVIEDPAVKSRFARASRRSSGFTHYFALKTILYARRRGRESGSYVLLFDEPGIYLHPSGQYDLLQVLETLAREGQLIYVTHSLFMINRTFPTRHRLMTKSEEGTMLDGKPYVGRWQSVLGALGMTLTGTILFSNYVVLTEGDSDPIYLYAMLQKGVLAGSCRVDLNAVSFLSTGESKNADVLIRIFLETNPRPTLGVLIDGDIGG